MVYQKEMNVEVRLAGDDGEADGTEGTMEPVEIKVLVKGSKKSPESLKIELTSESDLFFHYSKIETLDTFEELKLSQKLNLEFDGFIGLLVKLLTSIH